MVLIITSSSLSISLHRRHVVLSAHCMEEMFKCITGLRRPRLLQYLRLAIGPNLLQRPHLSTVLVLPCMCFLQSPVFVTSNKVIILVSLHRFTLLLSRSMQLICVEMLDLKLQLRHLHSRQESCLPLKQIASSRLFPGMFSLVEVIPIIGPKRLLETSMPRYIQKDS
jgi:hypothetical protein